MRLYCLNILLEKSKTPPELDTRFSIFIGIQTAQKPCPAAAAYFEWTSTRELEFYKELSLKEHCEIISESRQTFLVLISQALEDYNKALDTNVLLSSTSIRMSLPAFFKVMKKFQNSISSIYQSPTIRREGEVPHEFFLDQQTAREWLKKIAPLSLVDGAWLRHLNIITISFELRPIAKEIWQVFTEELGNGNRDQHR